MFEREWLLQSYVSLFVIVVGVVAAVVIPNVIYRPLVSGYTSLGVTVLGAVMLIASKWSAPRKGPRTSFGPSQHGPWEWSLYILGYCLITGGALVCLLAVRGLTIHS